MKKLFIFVIIFIISFIINCGLHTIPQDYMLSPDKESVVIGSLVVPHQRYKFFLPITFGTDISISLENYNSSMVWSIELQKKDGRYYFFVPLPIGYYKITDIRFYNNEIYFNAGFTVDSNGKIIHIGTLSITRPRRSMFQVKIVDEFENVSKVFREKYPHLDKEIDRSLAVFRKTTR